MDIRRLRLGELIAGTAALGLLVTLLADWNRDATTLTDNAVRVQSGGSALGWPVVLLLLIACGLGLALVVTTVTKRPAAIPIGAAVLTTAVGLLAVLVLAIRVLTLDDSLGGAYLGLAFAVLIPAGGWIAMADERTHAPYSAAPDLPRRPPPPVEA